MHAHTLQDVCNGDGTLAFGAGLSDPNDPDVSLTDFTGHKRLWMEVGQPEEKPLMKACQKADAVVVYAFHHAAEVWWKGITNKIARLDKLSEQTNRSRNELINLLLEAAIDIVKVEE